MEFVSYCLIGNTEYSYRSGSREGGGAGVRESWSKSSRV